MGAAAVPPACSFEIHRRGIARETKTKKEVTVTLKSSVTRDVFCFW
jgi:hypothetical protein